MIARTKFTITISDQVARTNGPASPPPPPPPPATLPHHWCFSSRKAIPDIRCLHERLTVDGTDDTPLLPVPVPLGLTLLPIGNTAGHSAGSSFFSSHQLHPIVDGLLLKVGHVFRIDVFFVFAIARLEFIPEDRQGLGLRRRDSVDQSDRKVTC